MQQGWEAEPDPLCFDGLLDLSWNPVCCYEDPKNSGAYRQVVIPLGGLDHAFNDLFLLKDLVTKSRVLNGQVGYLVLQEVNLRL